MERGLGLAVDVLLLLMVELLLVGREGSDGDGVEGVVVEGSHGWSLDEGKGIVAEVVVAVLG